MGHNSSAQPSGLGKHSRYAERRLKGGNNLKYSNQISLPCLDQLSRPLGALILNSRQPGPLGRAEELRAFGARAQPRR